MRLDRRAENRARERVSGCSYGRLPAPGRLAQLGEHQLDKLGVTGSSPVPPIEKPRSGAFLLRGWTTEAAVEEGFPCQDVRSGRRGFVESQKWPLLSGCARRCGC